MLTLSRGIAASYFVVAGLAASTQAQAATDAAPTSVENARNIAQANYVEAAATGAPRSLLHNRAATDTDYDAYAVPFTPRQSLAKAAPKKRKPR